MRIHQLKDIVYTSNVYLIETDLPVLIDTGGSLSEEIVPWVHSILKEKTLSALVLTHGHPDHIAGVTSVVEAFGVPVLIHEAEQHAVPQAQALGDTVNCGDVVWKVFHTPGHSSGGVCLYEASNKTLITGDCLFPGGRAGRWDLPGADFDALKASVTTLLGLEIKALYPGHYDPLFENIEAHLEASLRTLNQVGDPFDDDAYDRRIAELSERL